MASIRTRHDQEQERERQRWLVRSPRLRSSCPRLRMMGARLHDKGGRVKLDVYGGQDPNEIPAYPISEVARYLRLPKSTLRSWTLGQHYATKSGRHRFEPLIRIADEDNRMMSFMDLVEAHVLSSLRRLHGVHLDTIRQAAKRIRRDTLKTRHPLAEARFATVGLDLFVEELGRLVNLTRHGQLGLREALEGYLQRIERTPKGIAFRLYPFTRRDATPDAPRRVMIDARIAFGRPVIAGTNIPTATVDERFWAGESPEELAKDYERPTADILEAIRWERARRAA